MTAAAQTAAGETVSKGEFARLCNVSPGRVSQWISEGKIGPDALDGEGRSAKVRVVLAQQQLKRRIDPSQRFGNGFATQLDFDGAAEPAAEAAPSRATPAPKAVDPIEEQLRLEKLREVQYRNQQAAEKQMASRGVYVRADQSKAALTKVAVSMMTVFEGGLADLAHAVADHFEVPQRDVLHLLRTKFREVRTKAAEQAQKAAGDMPKLVADDVADA